MRILNARPSKFGCFTCRARRVKCDERKPKCARCEDAGRICTGYPNSATTSSFKPTGDSHASVTHHDVNQNWRLSAPRYALSPWEDITQERRRLMQLGLCLLERDPYRLRTPLGNVIWSSLLPQLTHSITLVGASVAALGAAYEAQFLRKGESRIELAVTKHYSYALQELFQQTQTQPHGRFPLILACTLLGAMEAIRRHQTDALTHSKGAFNVLSTSCYEDVEAKIVDGGIRSDACDMLAREDGFSLMLCRNVDLVIVSYSLRRAPSLGSWTPTFLHSTPSNIDQASISLAGILHSCFTFTSKVAPFKYRPRTQVPFDLAAEQGHHITNLMFWLQNFQNNELEPARSADNTPGAVTHSAFILKAQCLAALIYTSTISMAHEIAFDNYTAEFLEIIQSAEASMNQDEFETSSLPPYSPTMGVIMPLSFTAVKCRHPTFRRRAINLLRIAGIEGPWNGLIEAAIASRIVQIEEGRPAGSSLEPPWLSKPSEIGEGSRICRYAILDESNDNRNLIYRITVEFSQCSDMDQMMIGEEDPVDGNYWNVWQQELMLS